MKNCFIILFSLIVAIFLSSCKTYKVEIYKNSYENETLYMDEVFLLNCEGRYANCNTELTDSLTIILKESLQDLQIKANFKDPFNNVYNDSVWKAVSPPKYYAPKKVNLDYIKNFPYKNNEPKIVPFIYYSELDRSNPVKNRYEIFVHIFIFIFKDNKLVYQSDSWITNTTFYIPNLDDFKKEDIYTPAFIKPVIYKALNPYIERSGNGRVVKEKKDREKRRSENNIKVFN